MIIKTRRSEVDKAVGFVENYYVKKYGSRVILRFITSVNLETHEISKPQLYIAGEFHELDERSEAVYGDIREGIGRYIGARKPLHAEVGTNVPIEIEAKYGVIEGAILRARVHQVKTLTAEGDLITSPTQYYEELGEKFRPFVEKLLETDCSRLSFYLTRLGL